jgi:hydroxymethylpyrimidine/phosphomethylpyrimidine kinase
MDRSDPAEVSAAAGPRSAIALTIAGSDSGGGAGVQADLRTFSALGVYGASAITALTAQNTRGVRAVHAAPAGIVRAQIEAVMEDFDVAAIKIGMLANAQIVEAVVAGLPSSLAGEGSGVRGSPPPMEDPDRADPSSGGLRPPPTLARGEGRPFIVYDPVMAASSGDPLAAAGFVAAVETLLPLVDCLTPNLPEAAALLQAAPARSEAEMVEQGRALLALGPRAVLMKGGHLDGDAAADLLVTAEGVARFAAPKIASPNTHGTGCTLSSAIAAFVVLGAPLREAVPAAKAFVRAAIERGADARLGLGAGPLLQSPLLASATVDGQNRGR